ncbi:hypothetical protein [Methylophaga lonarensis]|nr:hypothetical protein [Methylophaga lonarensis]
MADEVGIDRNLLKRRLALMCGKVKKLAGLLSFDGLTEAEQDYANALIAFILKRNDWFEQQVAEFKPVIASL